MKIIDFIVTIFTMIDDFCQKFFPMRSLRHRDFLPKFTDSEVITMELVGEFMGFHEDKSIYAYFKKYWNVLFPKMPHRSNFARQAANLMYVKKAFFEDIQTHKERWLQIVDSMPIEVCKFVRAKYRNLFKGAAAFGKWFGWTFFWHRLHFKVTHIGMIRFFVVTPANIHNIRCVHELLRDDREVWVLGDKGYRSESLRRKLWDARRIYFHTSLRRNDTKTSPLPKESIHRLTDIRKLIEIVGGQLEQQFAIKKTYA